MFSYRHAFHAGNHADVLKHTVLIATLQHLTQKDAALMVLDTHAGAGLYRLDGDYAHTSGEAADGIQRLVQASGLAPALQDYVDLVRSFNATPATKVYPGSPFIAQHLLREHDKLKLFELHPTDQRTLAGNVAQLEAGRQVAVLLEDGELRPVAFDGGPLIDSHADGPAPYTLYLGEHTIAAEVVQSAPLALAGANDLVLGFDPEQSHHTIWECMTEFDWNGERGWGLTERSTPG